MRNLLKAFDHIAGSSLGASSDAETIIDLLTFIQDIEDSPQYNETFPPMDRYWKEFAVDMVCNPENLDTDYYSDLVDEWCSHALPVMCCFEWFDGEFLVKPYMDDDAPMMSETPDLFVEDVIYTSNDHGNVTCWRWDGSEYESVWSMV